MKKLTFLDSLKNWKRKLRWDRQYKSGKWNYLFENEEEPRYNGIINAITKYTENPKLLVADLHYYTPEENYDAIIFNEAFYYINHKLKSDVLERVLSKLNTNGILIVSIFKEGEGCWEFFNQDNLKLLEFKKIESSKENRYWKLGVYRKKN